MIKRFKDYFQDKKVFVTGHTGFKGTWLSNWLFNLESEVIGFSDKIPTNPSMFDILGLENYIKHIKGDITNFNTLNNVILENNPDIIIHLAAQPLVRKSYNEPIETYQTNVMGTINLLESLRNLSHHYENESKVVLNITTDKCYDNKEENYAYKETDPLGGYDPYSSSKACSEIVTSAYRRSFFNSNSNNNDHISKIAISTARAGNVIGGGDWSADRLVVDCVRSLSLDETIVLRNPHAIRPWQHVLEGLTGYLTLICHMIDGNNNNDNKNYNSEYNSKYNDNHEIDYNSSWNFGPYHEDIVDVEHLVNRLINNWGSGKYIVESDNKFHEANLLELDISKSLSYLSWKPKLSFEESVQITVEWYKEYYSDKNNMIDYTNKQIENYTKKN
ncbi:CDP-glucose 4,6-dehydratase [Methanobrevibacter cuticularis]|uniref:CDP-glucose 4,6-dehydratase n=1 Tax=Methanobrevibacter cuticularis TaxID=47311 RepID=A0A166DXV1_9EURY|nr:CDP-glucose 4,6-dehydratase [Methanobrevibacter cuticularis]KZX16068.1 CDP-glucose 4,6-dehydratase [Methanobrevibacter cuticularis]